MAHFKKFDELDIPEQLAKNLKSMGFEFPTPIQAQSIPPALTGRDILGTAQTGTGKTAAFGIPLVTNLYFDPRAKALILVPTRELGAQIHLVLRQMTKGLFIKPSLVVGGESFSRQVREFRDGADLIIATPGRLNDHLEEKTFSLKDVHYVVLDEVDRMLDMGFAPQVRQIMRHVPKERQTLLFSATLATDAMRLIDSFLVNPVRVAVQTARPVGDEAQIIERTIETTSHKKQEILLEELSKSSGKVLVFTKTKTGADVLFRILERNDLPVVCMHGGRSHGHRKQALEQFKKGKQRIMVATDLAGRGIDVSDIELVINYDIPQNREDYIHRMGRTGRYDKKGTVVNIIVKGDLDGERVISGKKPLSRVVFSSSRRRKRR